MKNFLSVKTYVLALAFGSLLSLISCNKELVQGVSPVEPGFVIKNGRMTFKNTSEFFKTLSLLRGFKTQEQIEEWEKNQNFNSLRQHNAESAADQIVDLDLPLVYKAILNPAGEYAVGDTIVWFNKGHNYIIPGKDVGSLAAIKQNPDSYKNRYEIYSQKIDRKNPDKDKQITSTDLGTQNGSGPDARYQKIWAINGQTGPWDKTVFEVQAYSIRGSNGYYDAAVLVRIKVEWYSPRNGWQAGANDIQDPYIDISGPVVYFTSNGGFQDYGSCNYNTGTQIPFHATFNHDTEETFFDKQTWDGGLATTIRVDISGTMHNSCKDTNGVYQTDSYYEVTGSLW